MVVSASYRTDIPAYYAEWFQNRLTQGFCLVKNPYSGRYYRVSLRREDVDCFVFWTKNAEPFFGVLDDLYSLGFPFVVHYSVTCYPPELEPRSLSLQECARHFRVLKESFGERVAVWRYDTIVLTSLTPIEFHVERFSKLSHLLEGTTDEVVVSWAEVYRKTRRNLDKVAEEHNFTWEDPGDDEKIAMLCMLKEIASSHGMKLKLCGQPYLLRNDIEEASCIDPARISAVAGRKIYVPKRPHRLGCGCAQSRDIGEYDSCPHGCVFCYAVRSQAIALSNYRRHDPRGPSIIPAMKY